MAGNTRRTGFIGAACISILLTATSLAVATDVLAPADELNTASGTLPSAEAVNAVSAPLASMPASAPVPAAKPAPRKAVTSVSPARHNPRWHELTPAQQQALAPLAPEWDKLEPVRKSKWLAIGNKYAAMKPDEQQRVQDRMREWLGLTPEQRKVARESYARARKLDADQKSAHWEQYQQLPPEQKDRLAADAAAKKRITTLPPASQAKAKTVPPIKATPKPMLEKSVTPQAAKHSALRPSEPPTK